MSHVYVIEFQKRGLHVVNCYIRYEKLVNSAILSARTLDVEEINKKVVVLFYKTTGIIYTSVDSIKNFDNGEIDEGLLPENLNR